MYLWFLVWVFSLFRNLPLKFERKGVYEKERVGKSKEKKCSLLLSTRIWFFTFRSTPSVLLENGLPLGVASKLTSERNGINARDNNQRAEEKKTTCWIDLRALLFYFFAVCALRSNAMHPSSAHFHRARAFFSLFLCICWRGTYLLGDTICDGIVVCL